MAAIVLVNNLSITLPNGSHTFGPFAVADAINRVDFSVSRWVGIAASLQLSLLVSMDSGVIWQFMAGTGPDFGAAVSGLPITCTVFNVGGAGRQFKLVADVAGGPIATAANLSVQ